jgi:hypothetical protein
MTLEQSIREHPMTWKDWVNALAVLVTLAAVLVQGGRLLEQQAVANAKLAELNLRLHTLNDQHSSTQRDITALRGTDQLHDEQIKTLRKDVDTVIESPRARR